jgi:hypothetical protein
MAHNIEDSLQAGDKTTLRDAIGRDMIRGAMYVAVPVIGIAVFIWVLWAIGEYGIRANLPAAEAHQAIDPTFEGYWFAPD